MAKLDPREREVRREIASYLRCEAFEARYSPDIAKAISGLANQVESEETIEDLCSNVGGFEWSSPYWLRPREVRFLIRRKIYALGLSAIAYLIGGR